MGPVSHGPGSELVGAEGPSPCGRSRPLWTNGGRVRSHRTLTSAFGQPTSVTDVLYSKRYDRFRTDCTRSGCNGIDILRNQDAFPHQLANLSRETLDIKILWRTHQQQQRCRCTVNKIKDAHFQFYALICKCNAEGGGLFI